MDAYSQIAGVIVFVLVAGLFIMFLILNSPEYESSVGTTVEYKQPAITYSLNAKFEAANKLLSRLNIAFNCIVLLAALFLLTLIFLIKTG